MNEQELFDGLSQLIPDLKKAENEYSTFDCTSEILNAFIELKCRHTHYNTLLIEKSKYARLVGEARLKGMIPLYINSTPEGVWSFNLDKFDIVWSEKDNLPVTTEFENVDKTTKVIGFLPTKEGDQLFWK